MLNDLIVPGKKRINDINNYLRRHRSTGQTLSSLFPALGSLLTVQVLGFSPCGHYIITFDQESIIRFHRLKLFLTHIEVQHFETYTLPVCSESGPQNGISMNVQSPWMPVEVIMQKRRSISDNLVATLCYNSEEADELVSTCHLRLFSSGQLLCATSLSSLLGHTCLYDFTVAVVDDDYGHNQATNHDFMKHPNMASAQQQDNEDEEEEEKGEQQNNKRPRLDNEVEEAVKGMTVHQDCTGLFVNDGSHATFFLVKSSAVADVSSEMLANTTIPVQFARERTIVTPSCWHNDAVPLESSLDASLKIALLGLRQAAQDSISTSTFHTEQFIRNYLLPGSNITHHPHELTKKLLLSFVFADTHHLTPLPSPPIHLLFYSTSVLPNTTCAARIAILRNQVSDD